MSILNAFNYHNLKNQLDNMTPEEIKVWLAGETIIDNIKKDNKEYLFHVIKSLCEEFGIDIKRGYFRYKKILIYQSFSSSVLIIGNGAYLFERCDTENGKEWRFLYSVPIKGSVDNIQFITKRTKSFGETTDFEWGKDPVDEFRITYKPESGLLPDTILLD